MPDVNMQPLRDLLAAHPEECAAVVAVLGAEGPDGLAVGDIHNQLVGIGAASATSDGMIERILAAGVAANLIGVSCGIAWIRDAHRYAIACVGAAAWLREKCGAKLAPVERIAAAFDNLAAINVVADGLDTVTADAVEQARLRLFVALEGTPHARPMPPEYGEDAGRDALDDWLKAGGDRGEQR